MNKNDMPIGQTVDVLIEIPMGSKVKYEYDEKAKMMRADRFLHTSMVFPANYGSILGTKGKDGDPLDGLIIASEPLIPGVLIAARIIGMLEMEDEGGVDHKIILLPLQKIDPLYAQINNLPDLPKFLLAKIKHFFEHYKELEEGKWVKIKDFKGREEAQRLLLDSL